MNNQTESNEMAQLCDNNLNNEFAQLMPHCQLTCVRKIFFNIHKIQKTTHLLLITEPHKIISLRLTLLHTQPKQNLSGQKQKRQSRRQTKADPNKIIEIISREIICRRN